MGMRVSELVTLPRSVLTGDGRVPTSRARAGASVAAGPGGARGAGARPERRLRGRRGADDQDQVAVASRGVEGHSTCQRLAQELKEVATEAGIDLSAAADAPRHAFVSDLLDRGVDPARCRSRRARRCRPPKSTTTCRRSGGRSASSTIPGGVGGHQAGRNGCSRPRELTSAEAGHQEPYSDAPAAELGKPYSRQYAGHDADDSGELVHPAVQRYGLFAQRTHGAISREDARTPAYSPPCMCK